MNDDTPLHLLNERVDRLESRLEARLDERHADLRERLDDLRADLAALTGALLARLDAHDEYHRANEHRWGLPRLAARHPLRLASLLAAASLALAAAPELRAFALRLLRDLPSWLP